jgi:hypothetical protein
MLLKHDIGSFLELAHPAQELPRWRYVYGGKPKPFFHPLCTPAGHCLTLFEPHDHVWHRGLWYTIKFINGENFWEENEPFGTQQTLLPPSVTHGEGGSVTVAHEQRWERPNGAGAVFAERRRFLYAPEGDDAYHLDFETELTAQADLLLDRTPFTTWGGYGGLVFRGNRNWQQTRLLFSDGSTSDRPTGIPADWADLSGKLDGGLKISGGVALFDHPENPRHPSPWYGATGAGHYINAAFLFHETMNVAAGQTLRFRYRVLVHDNVWEKDRLHEAYTTYLSAGAAG